MTHDRRNDPRDPNDPADSHDTADETRVVERQTYVERERPPEHYDPPPVQAAAPPPAGSQVNVNADQGGYVAAADPGPLSYVRRILSLIFGILAVLIALRLVFLLLVANQSNAIVDFVYAITEPFVAPFRGIFNFDNVGIGDATLDIAAVVALIGWFLIYLLIMAILGIGDRRRA